MKDGADQVLISRGLDQSEANWKVFARRIMFSFECKSSKEYGGESKKDTPVPMPNTEVKLLNAESSWWQLPARKGSCRALF